MTVSASRAIDVLGVFLRTRREAGHRPLAAAARLKSPFRDVLATIGARPGRFGPRKRARSGSFIRSGWWGPHARIHGRKRRRASMQALKLLGTERARRGRLRGHRDGSGRVRFSEEDLDRYTTASD